MTALNRIRINAEKEKQMDINDLSCFAADPKYVTDPPQNDRSIRLNLTDESGSKWPVYPDQFDRRIRVYLTGFSTSNPDKDSFRKRF